MPDLSPLLNASSTMKRGYDVFTRLPKLLAEDRALSLLKADPRRRKRNRQEADSVVRPHQRGGRGLRGVDEDRATARNGSQVRAPELNSRHIQNSKRRELK